MPIERYRVLKPGDADDDSSEEERGQSGRAGHLRISYDAGRNRQRARRNEEESDDEREEAKDRGYSSLAFDDKVQKGY